MTSRRRRSRPGRAGPRRQFQWYTSHINEGVLDGAQANEVLSSGIVDNLKKGGTIVRILIDLTVAATAIGTGGTLGLGIYMVSDDALAATAFADVDAESEQAGWMWRTFTQYYTAVLNDRASSTRLVYDIKSGRKFPGEDWECVLVLDNNVSGQVANVDGIIRLGMLKH